MIRENFIKFQFWSFLFTYKLPDSLVYPIVSSINKLIKHLLKWITKNIDYCKISKTASESRQRHRRFVSCYGLEYLQDYLPFVSTFLIGSKEGKATQAQIPVALVLLECY